MLWRGERTLLLTRPECQQRRRIRGSPISGRHGHARRETRSANAGGEAAGSFHGFPGAAWPCRPPARRCARPADLKVGLYGIVDYGPSVARAAAIASVSAFIAVITFVAFFRSFAATQKIAP